MAPRPKTPGSDGAPATELLPRTVGGRVVYAAPFDPAADRLSLPAPGGSAAPRRTLHPAETRSFFIGIAAGVLAALALHPEGNRS
jgi:hypothetical protein